MVTSEHSSGARRCQGGIIETGNGHVRRVLVEAAWSYRFGPQNGPPPAEGGVGPVPGYRLGRESH